jgi:small GTP-binding protein
MRLALEAERAELLDETRAALLELEQAISGLGVDPAARSALADAREQLEQPFLLVVVGEWNAGKSAFINALVGAPLLEEGVTPTTSQVTVLRHGEPDQRRVRSDGTVLVEAPAEMLRTLAIVDTPGTNAVLREHEALTREFLPRADLVVFVASADRPYSESERAFLAAIREWGKKVALVLNKADLLRSPADVAAVVEFVAKNAGETLGARPAVFALSASEALSARSSGDAAALARSGLPAFEAKVTATLDEAERFRLKLRSPLGVARKVRREAEARVAESLELVRGDLEALAAIEARGAGQAGEFARDFGLRVSELEKSLLEFERRGNAFFDDRLRLARFRQLFDRERLRREFEAEAVASLPRDVERGVDGVVDFLVEAELRQWQEVMRVLATRAAARPEAPAGVDDRFAYDRSRLLAGVREAAREAARHYDVDQEGRRLAEKVRESVAQAALLQVSALGLGAIVAVLASTTAADVTGILAASALSLIGLVLLPARREKARRELAGKVATLRQKLMQALTASFDSERQRAAVRVREAIAPYEAFVGAEQERLRRARASLDAVSARLEALAARAEAAGPSAEAAAEEGA